MWGTVPIGLSLIRAANVALSRTDTVQAAVGKVGLQTLFASAGRSNETGTLTYDRLQWDPDLKGVFAELYQSKVARAKLIAIVAGVDSYSDWFVALGDMLALHSPAIYYPLEPCYIIPELGNTGSPSKTLGKYLKDLRPPQKGGTAVHYVPTMPVRANAGGIRPGASNLLGMYMPAELAVHVTNHEFRGASSIYEYIDMDRALAVVGARILAGWKPYPWGQHGPGPIPPSLESLGALATVTMDLIEKIIDELFHLDKASPLQLWAEPRENAELRPMLHISFASMLMYYDHRVTHHEVREVRVAMHKAVSKFYPREDPAAKISEWGKLIRIKFDSDNAHQSLGVNARATDEGLAAQITRALGLALNEIKSDLASLRTELASVLTRERLRREVAALDQQLQDLRMQAQKTPFSPHPSTPGACQLPPSADGTQDCHSASSPLHQVASEPRRSSEWGSIVSYATGDEPRPAPMTLAGVTVGTFYVNCMGRGGVPPPGLTDGEKGRANEIIKYFNAMATDEEKLLLKPPRAGTAIPDPGDRRLKGEELHRLMIARLCAAYVNPNDVPRELGKGNLPASSFQNRLRALKDHLKNCKEKKADAIQVTLVDESSFAQWRREYEAVKSAASQPSAAKKRKAVASSSGNTGE